MRVRCRIILSVCLLMTSMIAAGELDPSLQDRIAGMSGDDRVAVWIQLEETESAEDFRKRATASAATRAKRNAFGLAWLQRRADIDQQNLVDALDELHRNQFAGNISQRWITNVIEAELSAFALQKIVARPDVLLIVEAPVLRSIEAVASAGPSLAPDSSTSNLRYIRADLAWDAGFTGSGRIICSFDTGVDGAHVALNGSWKGKDGDSAAAWFDPVFGESAPHILSGSLSPQHGTWITGILVGVDPITSETTGVAPGATWISAGVVDLPGASVLEAFEWAANPDGDPNTISDVPDVINHSWGFRDRGCVDILYDAIQNMEALGIVNIFASGNKGPVAGSVTNPADGALSINDSLSSFSVGSINHLDTLVSVSNSSSRGPSPCLGAIKPNVAAPGSAIRTTHPGNTYSIRSGTSLAAPHVSGLVALLRQKNPNATVDEIKQAILIGANRSNFAAVPNNDVGWGDIDCMAALNALSAMNAQPNIRVYDFTHPLIAPGDTVSGTVVLQNRGASAANVSLTISGSHPSLNVIAGNATFGNIAEGDTLRSFDSIRVVVAETVTTGSLLSIEIQISGDGFSQTAQLHFQVGSAVGRAFVSHTGTVLFSVSNYGVYGFGPGSFYPAGGVGFNYGGFGNFLYESGLIIGTGPANISSGVHSYLFEPDLDFVPMPGEQLQLGSSAAGQTTFSRYSDSKAKNPLEVEITQETIVEAGSNDDIVFVRYTIHNAGSSAINGLYVGLFTDWDSFGFLSNSGGYDFTNQLLWTAYNGGGQLSHFRGVKLIDGSLATAFTGEGLASTIYLPDNGGDGFTPTEKFLTLTDGMGSATTYDIASVEIYQLTAAGPINLPSGGDEVISFALLSGTSQAEILNAAQRAVSVPTDISENGDVELLPEGFALHQNFPNPFNPTTRIEFDLPRASDYTLTIYNMLGQTVHSQSGKGRAGRVQIDWQAENLSSGVYLYRLIAGDFSASRKMLLLK